MTRQKALVLLSEIDKELSLVKQTSDTIDERLKALSAKSEPGDLSAYTESLALNLHSFYEGVETIFERIIDFTGEDKPSGPEWHMELLERMTLPIKKLRPDVISIETAKNLDTFRAFRHKVRHIYGFMIIPENVTAIARKAGDVYGKLHKDLEKFMSFIEEIAEKT